LHEVNKKDPEQIWPSLFGILFNSFPNFSFNFSFFFLSHTNSWGKCVQHFATSVVISGLDWKSTKSLKTLNGCDRGAAMHTLTWYALFVTCYSLKRTCSPHVF